MLEKNFNQKGFSLIELILALGISTLVIISLLLVFIASLNAYKWGSTATDNQYMARRAINDIEKDVKEAKLVKINEENDILTLNEGKEEIRYYTQKQNLIRYANKSATPIAENVSLLLFEFQAENDNLLGIEIGVTSGDGDYCLKAQIFPRTFKP
ncbi:MAG: prepilin-type N-terminal cleavage/methylation domain-containing protein [Syntrophomonadaceae bacterium]|nr:prepilin-type N-terminal cleavage/methylation domain-containing protein [Syntrophomonadaceae bacterium]